MKGVKKMKKNKTATTVKKIAETMADFSFGTASVFGLYQPKQPKKISKAEKTNK